MTVPTKQITSDIMESVLLKGDLAKLTPDERVRYYGEVCKSLGLNPLTKPFEFITLNGKLQLYALRACADQLRKINGVSLEIVSREIAHDILTVHVRAKLADGRYDEDLGSVFFPDTLRGEARANTELKAVTKAKRRATLSVCGLGWLDETEVEDIPAKAKGEVIPAIEPPTPAAAALTSIIQNTPFASQGMQTANNMENPQVASDKPREVVLGDSPDWIWFGQTMIALSGGPQWPDWDEANRMNFTRMENEAPKVYARMTKAIKNAQKAEK